MSDCNAPPKAKRLKLVEEKSLSDNNVPPLHYDVFVSFRGEDIHLTFLSHLFEAFRLRRIKAFVDDCLVRGEEVSPSLVKAVEQSDIFLIIFSPDYASSRWCLQELVEILKCKENYGRIVIPVFYNVKPTDLRHPSSGSYKNALIEHETNHKTMVQKWMNALSEAAGLRGFYSPAYRNDAELSKAIVKYVLGRLIRPLFNPEGLIGVGEKIAEIESLIRREPKDFRLIGIWGMGGIGKTTLAMALYDKLYCEYEGCAFMYCFREESTRHGLICLRQEMFSTLLRKVVVQIRTPNFQLENIAKLSRMKVLIVLDDVNDSNHIERMLGPLDHFGPGSTVIVTTRDMQILKANNADAIYQVSELSSNEAFELFNLNAFRQWDHSWEYGRLSEQLVNYAKGIPLVLKVLARHLRGKNKEVWESTLYRLKKLPLREVYDVVMRVSFDSLESREQEIFLDLACFVLRLHRKVNVDNLKSLFKDFESDDSVIVGLGRLEDKGLITFSKHNVVTMHDSLKEMAWEIVRRESYEVLGGRKFYKVEKCSRLWDSSDIYEVLKNNEVTDTIRSIQIHLPTFKKQKLMPRIFEKFGKLAFLEISGKDNHDCYSELIVAAEKLQFEATELRYLSWYCFPLKSLPESFLGTELVILKLERGKMEKLWDGVKNLENLKELVLNRSKKLEELPDLSKAKNLEVLLLGGCSRLTSVHSSVFSLPKLEKLDLSYCKSVTILASDSRLCNLNYLNIDWCENLREFSLIAENIKELRLIRSDIEKLPSSFNNLTQLLHLHVGHCSKLQTIPELPLLLETLDVNDCESLESLPRLPQSLETLHIKYCESLKTVLFPTEVVEQLKENKNIQVLFWNCLNLDEDSLVAIGLNVQKNVMKFANQQISTQNADHDCDLDLKYKSYQAVYGYPGSSVPMWLEYQTRKDNIIIDLSSAPPSPEWGFIFCFVIECFPIRTRNTRLEFNITISDCVGEGRKESVWMYTNSLCDDTLEFDTEWESESDHVCVVYDQRCSNFLNNRVKDQTRFKIQVTMGTPRVFEANYNSMQQEALKGFGVSLVRSSTYNSCIRELHDSMSKLLLNKSN